MNDEAIDSQLLELALHHLPGVDPHGPAADELLMAIVSSVAVEEENVDEFVDLIEFGPETEPNPLPWGRRLLGLAAAVALLAGLIWVGALALGRDGSDLASEGGPEDLVEQGRNQVSVPTESSDGVLRGPTEPIVLIVSPALAEAPDRIQECLELPLLSLQEDSGETLSATPLGYAGLVAASGPITEVLFFDVGVANGECFASGGASFSTGQSAGGLGDQPVTPGSSGIVADDEGIIEGNFSGLVDRADVRSLTIIDPPVEQAYVAVGNIFQLVFAADESDGPNRLPDPGNFTIEIDFVDGRTEVSAWRDIGFSNPNLCIEAGSCLDRLRGLGEGAAAARRELQAAALSDGVLTQLEYAEAIGRFGDCLDAAGVRPMAEAFAVVADGSTDAGRVLECHQQELEFLEEARLAQDAALSVLPLDN